MAQSGHRKCLCCKLFLDPDHRNRERQRYCSQPECRRASKTVSQAAWLAQSDNHDYFRGPVHVARVQAWRAAHRLGLSPVTPCRFCRRTQGNCRQPKA